MTKVPKVSGVVLKVFGVTPVAPGRPDAITLELAKDVVDRLAAALTSYQAALAIAERLAKADPGNAGWQRDLGLSYGYVALIEMRQGVRNDALRAFQQGRDIIAQLMRQSPDNVTLHKDLAWFDRQMGTHEN